MTEYEQELKSHKFIVFSIDHYNPLGVLRSLGEKGLKPILICITRSSKVRIINKCRYISKVHYVETADEGLDLLLSEYGNERYKPFVYSCTDEVAGILDKNYGRLINSFFFFHGCEEGIISQSMNKRYINDLAVKYGCNVLKYQEVKRGTLPIGLKYPVITKAISPTQYAWKNDMHICKSEEDLKEAFKHITSENVLIQEFIEKKNELCIDGFAYNSGENVEMPYYTNYLRFTPKSYGGAMVLRPFEKGDVYNKVSKMLKEIGFTGVFEVEFLLDTNDTPYFLEINLRNSTWSYAYTYGGYNMPYLWALASLSGYVDISSVTPKSQFTALSESDDQRQEMQEHGKTFFEWLRGTIGYDCYYFWNKKDLKPSLRYWLPIILWGLFKAVRLK